MNLDAILGIVRAVLAALGGALVTNGVISSDGWTAVVGGIIAVVTAGWSYYHHTVQQPATIVTAESARAVAAGASASVGAAQGASISGASDATVAAARTAATVTP